MFKKHFVTFFSPGTFFSEVSTKEIDSWSIHEAIEMSKGIKERHGARPYGFKFTTKGREYDEWDPKVIDESGIYYLGGEVLTLEDVKKRNDPKDRILISNMECNGYKRVVQNANSYTITLPLNDKDIVLDSNWINKS